MPFGPNRLRNSTAPLPYCDTCGKLASHNASAYVELKPKWWRGLWFPALAWRDGAFLRGVWATSGLVRWVGRHICVIGWDLLLVGTDGHG